MTKYFRVLALLGLLLLLPISILLYEAPTTKKQCKYNLGPVAWAVRNVLTPEQRC